MNRIRPSTLCLVCHRDMLRAHLQAERSALSPDEALAASMKRQTENGICDPCQRDRQRAAEEYIHALEDLALLSQLGATFQSYNRATLGTVLAGQARKRFMAADDRCVHLKMWARAPRGMR